MATLKEQIRAVSRAYIAHRGLSRSRVSYLVFGDGKILDKLDSGGDLTTGRAEAALLWFSDNWPKGTRWPQGVRRPPRGAAA